MASQIKDEIKAEPDLDQGSPMAIADEDLYEDAGDLEMSGASQSTYLARIPKYLWKYLTPERGGQDGRLGTIRVEGSLDKPQRLSLMLRKDASTKDVVPLEYNLQLMQDANNTFIFTEQDLPGYQRKGLSFVTSGQPRQSMPYSQATPMQLGRDRMKTAGGRADKNQRFQGGYRRAVPKKTALTGKVKYDVNCMPVENEQYRETMDTRARQAMRPTRETQVLVGSGNYQAGNVIHPRSHGFQEFIKPIGVQRKPQDNKATRLPKNELMDHLADCFKRFSYWPLKALKAELRQPEAYLKSVLEEVAVLIRNGPHANTWALRSGSDDAHAKAFASARDAQAPQPEGIEGLSDLGESGSGDEDDNFKMEDVL